VGANPDSAGNSCFNGTGALSFATAPSGSLHFALGATRSMTVIRVVLALWVTHSLCMGTSIVFPAFDAPLVTEDAIFTSPTYGQRLICLDRASGVVRWEISTTAPIRGAWHEDARRIAVVDANKLSIVDTRQGAILRTHEITGRVLGRSPDGKILSITGNNTVISTDLSTRKSVWKRKCRERNSNISPVLSGDLLFLASSPRSISVGSNGRAEVLKGTNLLTCLSTKDGAALWREPVPLNRKGFGVHLQISVAKSRLLCTTDNALRLLEMDSGKVLNRWASEEDIDGADFWGDDRLAVCFGGIGARVRKIRILDAHDFTLIDEFAIDAVEVASAHVVGDVLLLPSLYRSLGVDLVSRKVIWSKKQRHYTIEGSKLYFGEHGDNKRILGVCTPESGQDTVIYSERIEVSPTKRGSE
jgi:PQQ-like domain